MEKWGLKFGKLVPKVKSKDLIKTWRVVKGDIVKVTEGKFKGKEGKVVEVMRKTNRVAIGGLNLIKKTIKTKDGKYQDYQVEQGIHASNVALLDPQTKKPARVFFAYNKTDDGEYKKIRVSKASGLEIPKPAPLIRERKMGPFDTSPNVVIKQTFFPSLDTFPIPKDCKL